MPETMNPRQDQEKQALHQARLENARKIVAQAEQELAGAVDEEERIVWANRLKQRREELEVIENEEV